MSRARFKKRQKRIKASAQMPMTLAAGTILGFSLGLFAGAILPLLIIGLIIGAIAGYRIDRANGVAYAQRRRKSA